MARRSTTFLGLAGAVAAAATLAAALNTVDWSTVLTPTPAGPKLAVRGHVSVPLEGPPPVTGGACAAPARYAKVVEGAPVTVLGADGAALASGKLGPGRGEGARCRFDFEIFDVPGSAAGDSAYFIEIAPYLRGDLTEQQARYTDVALRLG
jgi:hypothetical protein